MSDEVKLQPPRHETIQVLTHRATLMMERARQAVRVAERLRVAANEARVRVDALMLRQREFMERR